MDIDWDNDSNATLPTDQHQDQDPFLALACYVGSWLGTFSTEWWKREKSNRFRQLMINAPATDKSKEPSACWTTRFDCDTGRFTLIWWINSWILSCQASLRCRFLNKLENNAQNPDQRTSVTVSLRVVSTCWPWPSCCPTRIAAVLRVTWWLGNAETARTRPAFVQCLRGVKLGMFDACCIFKRQEVKAQENIMTILDWEHLGTHHNHFITHLSFKLLPYLPSTAVAFARLGLADRMSPRPRFLHWHSRLSARAPRRNVA